jgi:DNA invertase Pin-like site-specific DNA recombinase
MKCAIYARKSNEQNGIADESKSIARQVEHARLYARERGWTVLDDYVFADDAVSGAEFAKRPGLVKLLNAAGRRAPFDALIVSELSRIGREQLETGYVMKQLAQAGVAVWSYLDRKEILMSSSTDKFLLSAMTFAAEVEREKARERSRDAARQRATHGYVTGGTCYGYRNRRTESGHVVREIDAAEAEVVRKIFRLCRDGKGTRRIAAVLNAEGAPAPRAQQGRPRGWVPSSVRAVLYRECYRGVSVWGRAQKRNAWGQVETTRRPESEWLRADAPQLRIVSDDLWEETHERLSSSRANYLRHTDGKLWGKPANGVESKYLLTGMASCGECGGGMLVYSRKGTTGKSRQFYYACPRARVGVCANDLEVSMGMADATAVAIVGDDVLAPDVVTRALEKLMAMFDGPAEDVAARRARLAASVRKVDGELANLSAAVASGAPPETLLAALRERERQRRAAQAELAALDEGPQLRKTAASIRADALALLDGWRALLGRHVGTSRQLLRKVLDRERFVFYPMGSGRARWYDLGVTPTLDRFFGAVPALKKAVASPPGFEPGFQP